MIVVKLLGGALAEDFKNKEKTKKKEVFKALIHAMFAAPQMTLW